MECISRACVKVFCGCRKEPPLVRGGSKVSHRRLQAHEEPLVSEDTLLLLQMIEGIKSSARTELAISRAKQWEDDSNAIELDDLKLNDEPG